MVFMVPGTGEEVGWFLAVENEEEKSGTGAESGGQRTTTIGVDGVKLAMESGPGVGEDLRRGGSFLAGTRGEKAAGPGKVSVCPLLLVLTTALLAFALAFLIQGDVIVECYLYCSSTAILTAAGVPNYNITELSKQFRTGEKAPTKAFDPHASK
ncbi:hypothetical protein HDU80_009593 [Chytriomyces hyalinus]|nr:hypothetical protein HDU80_009593 [Chytriomyces hyalinus]